MEEYRDKTEQKLLIDSLEKEIKDKEKDLKKISKDLITFQKQLSEKEKTIEELRNKPLPATKTSITSSTEKLLKIIEEQKQEIQRLKALMVGETSQETPVKETVQQLPKKNASALWLCLLGYSLGAIVLCLDLLKKWKKKKHD